MSPNVLAPWPAVGHRALDGENPSEMGAGVEGMVGVGSGPVVKDWNVVVAGAAVARVDKETGLAQGSGPGC